MHDLKFIRENADTFDRAMERRGLPAPSNKILALDEKNRALQTTLQEVQATRNAKSKEIGAAIKQGLNADALQKEVSDLKEKMQNLEEQSRGAGAELKDLLAALPNMMAADVPDGKTEEDNVLLREWGTIPTFDFTPKEHFDLGEALGLMNFERAAKVSGARFVFLTGALARLERALAQHMLNKHTGEFEYTEVNPPVMVNDEALFGTGQLPKFAQDQFKTTDGYWLIPTAEVVLTNMHAGEILAAGQLPMRFAAYTPCFRSEAGSAGKDTRGMIRHHQFHKVELVSVVHPDTSWGELERMTSCATSILEDLEIAHRVVTLCSGDTGFGAAKTYDIEVWLPGQDRYREISSCSNTLDFQARRMKMRYREAGEKQTKYPHTLNGSGLALGRTLIAVIENYQQPDGSIKVPKVLEPYMGGIKEIKAGETV